jgi:acid phosphatase type 7
MKFLTLCIAFLFSIELPAQTAKQDLIVKPYLQIGSNPGKQSLQLLWHTAETGATWLAEYKTNGQWIKAEDQTTSKITTTGIEPFSVYNASFSSLIPGDKFMYRVSKNGTVIFTAAAKAPKTATQAFRFVASGDMGAGTKEAKQVAKGIYKADPDFVAIAGDIVYEYGLIADYSTKFWPIYNADKGDTVGVPLLRSTPFVAAVGNHDADTRDLDKFPGALAYYLFWDQPLNGPLGKEGGASVPLLKGSDANRSAFMNAAGNRYPRMTNFSFNYSNAHWTVIDADNYVDWTDSVLKNWVANDLAASKDADWHFVLYHHPGFSSSWEHFEQQQMRLLAPVFEKGNVDIVFNGHVHNYQRSYPITFIPDRSGVLLVGGKDNKTLRGRVVNGKWTLDKKFDGKKNTQPNGVIYIVTGAGGQTLYNPEQQNEPDTWQKFTDKFISTIHSFTVVDIKGKNLKLRQVDVNGKEVDAVNISK